MFQLIRLEWKKNNIGKYIRYAIITSIVLLLLVLMVAGEMESAETMQSYGKSMLISCVDMFTNLTYILFTSVMIAGFCVSPYQNRTINLVFSYPVGRKKLVLAQIASVWIFNFIALVLSKVCFYGTIVATSAYTQIAAEKIPLSSGEFYADILAGSAAMVSIGFLALPVGLWMKSSKAAIIVGVIIVCFTQGNIGSYTLINNLPFYGALICLAAAAVISVICTVESRDVA